MNKKRKARLFAEDFGSKEYRAWIVSMPCEVCGAVGRSDPAHVRSRGAGGKAADIVPLCRTRYAVHGCHLLFDEYPWELPEGTATKLAAAARELWRRWQEQSE